MIVVVRGLVSKFECGIGFFSFFLLFLDGFSSCRTCSLKEAFWTRIV